jgi:hypothetical protein
VEWGEEKAGRLRGVKPLFLFLPLLNRIKSNQENKTVREGAGGEHSITHIKTVTKILIYRKLRGIILNTR